MRITTAITALVAVAVVTAGFLLGAILVVVM